MSKEPGYNLSIFNHIYPLITKAVSMRSCSLHNSIRLFAFLSDFFGGIFQSGWFWHLEMAFKIKHLTMDEIMERFSGGRFKRGDWNYRRRRDNIEWGRGDQWRLCEYWLFVCYWCLLHDYIVLSVRSIFVRTALRFIKHAFLTNKVDNGEDTYYIALEHILV